MSDASSLAPALWGIPVVADAAARDAIFPLATRSQDQRCFNKASGAVERWSGSAWVTDLSNATVGSSAIAAALASANAYTDAARPQGTRTGTTLASYLGNNALFNVKDYGAVGNGSVDDGPAFLLALNAVTAAGGGTLFIPAGTYNLARNYLADNITCDNVRILGVGRSSIITNSFNYAVQVGDGKAGNENYNAFQATGRTGITIEQVSFTKTAILMASSCTDITIRNCSIDGFHDTVFQDKAIYLYKCARTTITGNTFKNVNFSVYLSGDGTTKTSQTVVSSNHFEIDQLPALFLITSFPTGVYVYFADDTLVVGNTFKNIYSRVDSGTTGTGMGYGVYEGDGGADRLVVTGNTFRYTGRSLNRATAIYINTATTAIVSANTISAVLGLSQGILIDAKATGVTREITGNALANAEASTSTFGVYLSGADPTHTNVGTYDVSHNTILGFGSAIRADYLGSGVHRIAGNVVRNQLAAAIVLNGYSANPIKFPQIHNNYITGAQAQGISLGQYVISASIQHNTVLDGNLGNNAGAPFAAIAFSSNSHGSLVQGNTIGNTPGGGGLFQYGVSNTANTTSRIFKDITRNNTFLGINVLNQQFSLFPAASPTVSIFDIEYADFVENVTQNANGVTGWQCVSAKLLTPTADASSASTTVAVPTSGVLAGDIILLVKDSNPYDTDYSDTTKWHADTVASITDGSHLVLTTGIPGGDGTYTAGTARAKVARFVPIGIVGMTQAAALADVAAMTAPATFSAAYTKTESEALRADVLAVRAAVNTLLANRRAAGEQA